MKQQGKPASPLKRVVAEALEVWVQPISEPLSPYQQKVLAYAIYGVLGVSALITLGVILLISMFAFSSCTHTTYNKKMSKYEAVYTLRQPIMEQCNNYKKHFIASPEDVATVIGLIVISETSAPLDDGKWYPLQSPLVEYNNILGMKANKQQLATKQYTIKRTWEYVSTTKAHTKVVMCDKFATFTRVEDCIEAWFTNFILQPRYKKVREASNVAEILIQLQQCGYMTDVEYPKRMLNICKDNNIASIFK